MAGKFFTLVEMLVVVAIIAILAALLMPSLHTALASARSVSCQSNLRQLNLGMQEYIQQNYSWFPSAAQWHARNVTSIYNYHVKHGIRFYLGNADDDDAILSILRGCPDSSNYGKAITYSMNDKLGGIYQWPPAPPRRKLNKLVRPQSTICLIDARIGTSDLQITFLNRGFGIDRHAGRPNILWADGHISAEHTESIYEVGFYWDAPSK